MSFMKCIFLHNLTKISVQNEPVRENDWSLCNLRKSKRRESLILCQNTKEVLIRRRWNVRQEHRALFEETHDSDQPKFQVCTKSWINHYDEIFQNLFEFQRNKTDSFLWRHSCQIPSIPQQDLRHNNFVPTECYMHESMSLHPIETITTTSTTIFSFLFDSARKRKLLVTVSCTKLTENPKNTQRVINWMPPFNSC